ncbi:hypothetical protein LZ30DRAFT_421409 [Colletotrichum cereale]|nr:hypothetical protein LZ30DRAFT_421409 [Colletotrichum cereale]
MLEYSKTSGFCTCRALRLGSCVSLPPETALEMVFRRFRRNARPITGSFGKARQSPARRLELRALDRCGGVDLKFHCRLSCPETRSQGAHVEFQDACLLLCSARKRLTKNTFIDKIANPLRHLAAEYRSWAKCSHRQQYTRKRKPWCQFFLLTYISHSVHT